MAGCRSVQLSLVLWPQCPSFELAAHPATGSDRLGRSCRGHTAKSMITYPDGTEVKVGDSVLIEHRRTSGVVTEVIDSVMAQRQWNVEEPGVMLESAPFGRVFWPVSLFSEDPPVLVSRAEAY